MEMVNVILPVDFSTGKCEKEMLCLKKTILSIESKLKYDNIVLNFVVLGKDVYVNKISDFEKYVKKEDISLILFLSDGKNNDFLLLKLIEMLRGNNDFKNCLKYSILISNEKMLGNKKYLAPDESDLIMCHNFLEVKNVLSVIIRNICEHIENMNSNHDEIRFLIENELLVR